MMTIVARRAKGIIGGPRFHFLPTVSIAFGIDVSRFTYWDVQYM